MRGRAQTTHQDLLNQRLGVIVETFRKVHFLLEDLLEGEIVCSAAERRTPDEELVEDAAKRPNVGATVGSGWSHSLNMAMGTHAKPADSFRRTSGLTKSAEPTNDRFLPSSTPISA